jgi:TniQ protein
MSKHERLIRTRGPEADESFFGYIVRLTERNFYESPSWILRLSELDPAQLTTESAITFESSKRLSGLSRLTGVNANELARITYGVAASPKSEPLYWFFNQLVPQYVIRLKHPKICPECLAEAPYCRRIWDLSIFTTCPEHKRLLIDECPKCKKIISWARNSVSTCRCEFDWREIPKVSVKESELDLARHIYRLCGLASRGGHISDPADQNPVLKLSLQDLLTALFFIAGQYQGLSSVTSKHLTTGGRNKDNHAHFIKAYSVFQDWPKNYYRFLNWRRTQERNVSPSKQRLKSTLYEAFGKFYIGLYNMLSASQFDFMRSEFSQYLIKNRGSDCDSRGDWSGNETRHSDSGFISKTDARRLLGIDNGTMNELIKTGTLMTKVRSKGKKRLIFIDLVGLTNLKSGLSKPLMKDKL